MEGWIKIHRKILEWEWYNDINTKTLFFHLLLTANHKEKRWRGQTIQRGQKITSISHLAKEIGLTTQQIRTSLKKLKLTNEITTKVTNKYTVITIEKYSDYQINDLEINKQNNKQTNNQVTTNKNDKNIKNNKNIINNISVKHEYGEYQNVLLKDEELEKLKKDYNNWEDLIKYLDEYIEMKGYKAKSHYLAIKKWVVKAVKENKQNKQTNYNNYEQRNYENLDNLYANGGK